MEGGSGQALKGRAESEEGAAPQSQDRPYEPAVSGFQASFWERLTSSSSSARAAAAPISRLPSQAHIQSKYFSTTFTLT